MDEMNTRTVDSLRFSSDERRQLQVAVRGVDERTTRMDERATEMDERPTIMDERATRMDETATRMDERATRMDIRPTMMDERATRMEERRLLDEPNTEGQSCLDRIWDSMVRRFESEDFYLNVAACFTIFFFAFTGIYWITLNLLGIVTEPVFS